jgi:hypothetical protein
MTSVSSLSVSGSIAAAKKKIVVLDVDETLGYFVELGIFCDALTTTAWNADTSAQYAHFNQLMDAYPEFLRPNILDLLRFLKLKKEANECCGVMVYTNNNGPREWVEHIIKYMESKLGGRLFDQIVAAFKVNGKLIEMGRTTHDKTYEDLLRCTKLPSNVEVCFLDDQMHSQMEHGHVYYINVKPYVHQLSVQTLVDRFIQSHALRSTISQPMSEDGFRNRIAKIMQRFQAAHVAKDPLEQQIDAIISKKIMEHLNDFFNSTITSTQKPKHGGLGLGLGLSKMQMNPTTLKMKNNNHISKTRTLKRKFQHN